MQRGLELLSDREREALVDGLVDAVGFAKAGLADILVGKRAKPTAWTLDIFVSDVCDALAAANVPVLMDPDPEASHAQSLARKLARAAGLPGAGNLFKQMQRAKRIRKRRLGVSILVWSYWDPQGSRADRACSSSVNE